MMPSVKARLLAPQHTHASGRGPRGRGFRVVDAPPFDSFSSSMADGVLEYFFNDLRSLQRISAFVLVLDLNSAKLDETLVDVLRVCQSLYGLEILDSLLIAFADSTLDVSSPENRKNAAIATHSQQELILSQLRCQFHLPSNYEFHTFVLNCAQGKASPGTEAVISSILEQSIELEERTLVDLLDIKQSATDSNLRSDEVICLWGEARSYLENDLLRRCDLIDDPRIQRQSKLLRQRLGKAVAVADREELPSPVHWNFLVEPSASSILQEVDERLTSLMEENSAKRFQSDLSRACEPILHGLRQLDSLLRSTQEEEASVTCSLVYSTLTGALEHVEEVSNGVERGQGDAGLRRGGA
ncbi:unnamed protein product [Cyprideis torosa]|uniref:Uncharacterized protein n=1 Tax=Cyprideis torosa TaxID=163714 RepID=A0A7R8W4G6_9CRUS|nr:unnamed protein product [Cyprideis torosa]CAG0880607.1 unnamed protein product [Cyprideis torosa]